MLKMLAVSDSQTIASSTFFVELLNLCRCHCHEVYHHWIVVQGKDQVFNNTV